MKEWAKAVSSVAGVLKLILQGVGHAHGIVKRNWKICLATLLLVLAFWSYKAHLHHQADIKAWKIARIE